jgi:pyruvate/2-oxoglutarate dehydrogenase complex dihydrolipoamide acyltransferase (E2) component
MAENIIMPQLGETVAEGKILTWFKKVGDSVAIGDRLFEVETDKVTIDVEAVAAGTITEIAVGDGETAAIGVTVAVLDGAAAGSARPAAPTTAPVVPASASAAPAPIAPPAVAVLQAPVAMSVFEEVRTPVGRHAMPNALADLRVTPLARRLIAQNGVDTSALAEQVRARRGTRIGRADVEAAIASAASKPAPVEKPKAVEPSPAGNVIPFNTIRKRTGERLAENWRAIPHVYQAVEVDFTAIDKVRARHKDAFKASTGLSLTYLPFITRATAIALSEFPKVNARFDGTVMTSNDEINIGVAVDLGHDGLVVPVVRNADGMTVSGLARAIGRQVDKARSGKLGADDFGGGTYSITNNGAFGTLFTTPIINAPQVAILSTDAIRLRPAVVETDAGPAILPRMMGIVGQSFDHRAFDGAYSAAFLSRLKTILETRDWQQELA